MEILVRALGATIEEETGVQCTYPWEDERPDGTLLIYPMKPQLYNSNPNDQVHEDPFPKTIENIGLNYSLSGNNNLDYNKAMLDLHKLTKFFSKALSLDTAKTFFHPTGDGEERAFVDVSNEPGITVPCIFREIETEGDIYTADDLGSNGFQISAEYMCQIPLNINDGIWDTSEEEVEDPLLALFKGYTGLTDGLHFYLPCDDKEGNTLTDISGNDRHFVNTENYVPDIASSDSFGDFIDLGGVYDKTEKFTCEDFGAHDFVNNNIGFTVSFLYYLEVGSDLRDAGEYLLAIGFDRSGDQHGGLIYSENYGDKNGLYFYGSSSFYSEHLYNMNGSQDINTGQWVHCVFSSRSFDKTWASAAYDSVLSSSVDGGTHYITQRNFASNGITTDENWAFLNGIYKEGSTTKNSKAKIKHLCGWHRPLGSTEVKNLNNMYKARGILPISMTRTT